MSKRLTVVALSVFALAGLLAAPAANAAGPSGCLSVHVNVNGTDLVNQDLCTP